MRRRRSSRRVPVGLETLAISDDCMRQIKGSDFLWEAAK